MSQPLKIINAVGICHSGYRRKFADASSKPCFEGKRVKKIFGGFTNSASINGDKLNTLPYFFLLVPHLMRSLPVMSKRHAFMARVSHILQRNFITLMQSVNNREG